MTTGTPNRRERHRAATLEEIHATARQLLVKEGVGGVTLRAISRAMGMTAPALYRYYASLDDLLKGLSATFVEECAATISSAVGAVPAGDTVERMFAACRGFRTWAIGHPAEFAMMFSSPMVHPHDRDSAHFRAAERFLEVFLVLYVELCQTGRLRVMPDEDVPQRLREQFAQFVDMTGAPLSCGAIYTFASSWVRLYGIVALETFGHLYLFVPERDDTLFEAELAGFARDLGLRDVN